MELHMHCWDGGGFCFNSGGVFSWELFSAEPENSWWHEFVGVVWFSCSNFILLLLHMWFIPGLDVSMDTWNFLYTCLVSLWLHRIYIYSVMAFGISLWIAIQFFTTKAKRKVTECLSTFLWEEPKICVWKGVVVTRWRWLHVQRKMVGSPWFLQIPVVAYLKLQPPVWIVLSVDNYNTFVPLMAQQISAESFSLCCREVPAWVAQSQSKLLCLCPVHQVSLSSDLSGKTELVLGWECCELIQNVKASLYAGAKLCCMRWEELLLGFCQIPLLLWGVRWVCRVA